MRRREFISLLGTGALTWPLAARAQQTSRLPTIGYLGVSSRSAQSQLIDAFLERLRQLDWNDGRNLKIEYHFADGRPERFAEIAAHFVRLNVDIIFTSTDPTALAAKQATSTIPIVFVSGVDPVGNGLVASLSRPGGNVTGISFDATDLAGRRGLTGKRIELLREIVPNLHQLGIVVNIDNKSTRQTAEDAQEAAKALNIGDSIFPIRRVEDIPAVFDALKGHVDTLFVPSDPVVFIDRARISTLALAARLPTLMTVREQVEAGGLLSYGPDLADEFRRGAEVIDKILRGAKPNDIPVEQPTRFDLVINLRTAKTLGLTLPPVLLATADEVIQ